MKLFSVLSILVILMLVLAPTTYATSVAAPTNTCAVSWQPVTVPDVGDLYAVEVISATDIWTGGSGDFLHWNGATWSQVAKPESGTVTRLSASAPDDVWALVRRTSKPDAKLMHWNGMSWAMVEGSPGNLYDIYAVSANDVWGVGLDFAFHWDGSEWKGAEIFDQGTYHVGIYIYSVTVSNGQVYAGGYSHYHGFVAKWDGAEWHGEFATMGVGVQRLVSDTANNVWALMEYPSATYAYFRNGDKWALVAGLPVRDIDVAPLALDDVYIVGRGIWHWDGTEWVNVLTPPHVLRGVAAVSASELWAVGDSSTLLHGTPPCAAPGCTAGVAGVKPKHYKLDKQIVTLKWQADTCADFYKFVLYRDEPKGARIMRKRLTGTHVLTPTLQRGHKYYWRVRACNEVSCSLVGYHSFEIVP